MGQNFGDRVHFWSDIGRRTWRQNPSRFLRYFHQQDIQFATISALSNVQEPEGVKQCGGKYGTVLGGYPLRLGVFSVQENDNDPDGASLFVLCSRESRESRRTRADPSLITRILLYEVQASK